MRVPTLAIWPGHFAIKGINRAASGPAAGGGRPLRPGGGLGGGPTYVAYEYTAQAQNVMCPPSPVSPDGGVTLTVAKTVCCQ